MKTNHYVIIMAMLLSFTVAKSQELKRQKGASVPSFDSDTIRVANSAISVATVRLEGIDMPEATWEGGKEPADYRLHHLLLKKQAMVEWNERLAARV